MPSDSDNRPRVNVICSTQITHIFYVALGLPLIGGALRHIHHHNGVKIELTVVVVDHGIIQKFDDAEIPTESIVKLNYFQNSPLVNPYKLSSDEIQHQYETAKVSGLKTRVRRFACWHSCFGQFRKRTPVRKTTANRVQVSEGPKANNDSPAPASDTNELGDANQGPRQKKSPAASEFYKEVVDNELREDKTNKASENQLADLNKKNASAESITVPPQIKVVLQSDLEKAKKLEASSVEEEEYESGEFEENEETADAASYEEDDEYYDEDKSADGKANTDNNDDGIDQDQDETEEEGF